MWATSYRSRCRLCRSSRRLFSSSLIPASFFYVSSPTDFPPASLYASCTVIATTYIQGFAIIENSHWESLEVKVVQWKRWQECGTIWRNNNWEAEEMHRLNGKLSSLMWAFILSYALPHEKPSLCGRAWLFSELFVDTGLFCPNHFQFSLSSEVLVTVLVSRCSYNMQGERCTGTWKATDILFGKNDSNFVTCS